MLLSIVVLSYNRPIQLRRILDHFIGFADNRVKLIIKDDQSPSYEEIEKIFNYYRSQLEVECELYRNDKNIGYDLNLWSSFWCFNSDYIFFLSDDDYIKTEFLSSLLDELSLKKYKFYFTPFIYNGVIGRQKINTYDKKRFSEVIYNSILFSGLIFESNAVRNIKISKVELENSIYSQVILSSILIFKTESFGIVRSGILYVGRDGENYFGKNPSTIEKDKLFDRTLITSNLNYQKYLLSAVAKIASHTESNIYYLFLKEYKKRLIGYMLKSRALGIKLYLRFMGSFLNSHARKYRLHLLLLFIFCLYPAFVSRVLYNIGLKYMRKDD
jgi:hypothetical protein